MKKIKLLDQQKANLILEERRIREVTYQTEKDKIDYNYSFSDTRNKISEIDSETRKLKHLLNYSNAFTVVEGFNMTIGECLIYMAQLNNEKYILEEMSNIPQTSRHSTVNGVIEYTELNYDRAECQEKLFNLNEELAKLQIAIDRANLTNLIDIG
jgi:hypothetical protein